MVECFSVRTIQRRSPRSVFQGSVHLESMRGRGCTNLLVKTPPRSASSDKSVFSFQNPMTAFFGESAGISRVRRLLPLRPNNLPFPNMVILGTHSIYLDRRTLGHCHCTRTEESDLADVPRSDEQSKCLS